MRSLYVTIKNQIEVKGLTPAESAHINQACQIPNQQYLYLVRAKKFAGNVPRTINYAHEEGEGDTKSLLLPRGLERKLALFLDKTPGEKRVIWNYQTVDTRMVSPFTVTGELRPYQKRIVKDTIDRLEKGETNHQTTGIISMATGTGKTITALALSERLGLKTLVIVPNNALLANWLQEIEQFTNCKSVGIVNGEQQTDGDIVVATWQSAKKSTDDYGLVIIDECFVKHTKVLTKNGYKCIEKIKIGDEVSTPLGFQRVRATIKREAEEVVEINTSEGRMLVTKNHPFLTSRGWKKSGDIVSGDELLTNEFCSDTMSQGIDSLNKKYGEFKHMQDLSKRVPYYIQEENVLLKKLSNNKQKRLDEQDKRLSKQNGSGSKFEKSPNRGKFSPENVVKQPVEEKGRPRKDFKNHEKVENYSKDSRWKRKRSSSPPKDSLGGSWGGVVFGTGCCNPPKTASLSSLLQNRYCKCKEKDSDRDRRGKSQFFKSTRKRLEENKPSYFIRVESVSIQESRSDERNGKSFEVYNLEVENCPMYVVNGVVVHNCHGVTSDERRKTLKLFSPKHIIGLSGTVDRSDGQKEGIHHILGKIIAEHEGESLKPTVEVVYSGVFIATSSEYHTMIEDMINNENRNKLIVGLAVGEMLQGRRVLVLCKRIAHYKNMEKMMGNLKDVFFIDSTDPDRNQMLIDFKTGEKKFNAIFGTTSLLSVGVDVPSLDTLIIACDIKSSVLTTQSVGRILRLFEGKENPKVIDIYDNENKVFSRQFWERKKVYIQKGWLKE